MKDYKDYSDEISKCSKCGLCKKVCPVWELFKTEESYARGKLNLLSILNKSCLPPTKKLVQIVDMCALCGKCDEFCPSLIPCSKIFKSFQRKYSKKKIFPLRFLLFIFGIIFKILSIFRFGDDKVPENKKDFVFCPSNIGDCEFFDGFITSHPVIAVKMMKKFTDKVNDGDDIVIGCQKCEALLRFILTGRNVQIRVKK